MGQRLGDSGGGIWGLIQLHDEHPRAFEASLIRAGVRWRDVGSVDFTWADCVALIETLSWDDPLTRAVHPDDWAWGNPMQDIVVSLLDMMIQVNAKTPVQDKRMKANLPKRIPRPWDKTKAGDKITGAAKSLAELDKFLDSRMRGE